MKDGPARSGCDRVQGRLEPLLDGALDPLAAARDRGHLEACPACAAELARLERLLATIRAAAAPRAAELALARRGLAERIAAAAPLRPRLRLASSPALRAVATAAAAILALLALELVGPGMGEVGTMPGWIGELLARAPVELPAPGDLLGDLWGGGNGG
ncbi:MAG: zf-HC2 domain-containing protein [Planctomycetota bacterium]